MRWLLISLGVCCSLAWQACEVRGARRSFSDMVLVDSDRDFGAVDQSSQTLTHTFHLINSGEVPVTISEVKASCGCTSTRLDRKTLPPGAASDLHVALDVATIEGLRRAEVVLQFPDGSTKRLGISAFVKPDIRSSPERLELTVLRDVNKSTEISLYRMTAPLAAQEFEALGPDAVQVLCDHEAIRGKVLALSRTETEAGTLLQYDVSVVVSGNSHPRQGSLNIVFPDGKRKAVPYSITMGDLLNLTPSLVMCGNVKRGTSTACTVLVSPVGQVKALSAKSFSKSMKCQLGHAPGVLGAYELVVNVEWGLPPGPQVVRGEIEYGGASSGSVPFRIFAVVE